MPDKGQFGHGLAYQPGVYRVAAWQCQWRQQFLTPAVVLLCWMVPMHHTLHSACNFSGKMSISLLHQPQGYSPLLKQVAQNPVVSDSAIAGRYFMSLTLFTDPEQPPETLRWCLCCSALRLQSAVGAGILQTKLN